MTETETRWSYHSNRKRSLTTEERFWEKVERGEECWEWRGTKTDKGYGHFHISKERHAASAHRFSWELAYGPLSTEKDDYYGVCVLHRCDNPSCVRPDHLFLGSQLDNIRDRHRKGRTRGTLLPGQDHRAALLTNEQAAEMRRLYGRYGKGGWTQQRLADHFGVSRGNVSKIVNAKSYKEGSTA